MNSNLNLNECISMLDYKSVGLKCGLELHQQLDTGKLFCRCPSVLREDKPDFLINRRLRPVASELGEYDTAAVEAYNRGLTYQYQVYSDTNCLVETDDEPPSLIDMDALETVLEISLLCNSSIQNELYVMRKAVIDGSNTSAFQRTMLVAEGGNIQLKDKKIGVQSIIIEEDAARPIEKKEKEIIYRLDRLGIPLIELATDPELFTPEEVKEAALAIGNLFRQTGKVKRGLGTIRQDLNISIKECARVEVKGVQDLENIDEYVRREVERQIKLIEIRDELKKRGVKESDITSDSKDVSSVFTNTECKLIKNNLPKLEVHALKLPKFKGIIGKELQTDSRFGTELARYVKVKARLNGIFHSDEMPKYGISEAEVKSVAEQLNCGENDAFVIVVATREKAVSALGVVAERCREALNGVPEETRNALEGGNTEYSRPLPGAARMYPETDLAPVEVSEKLLADLKKKLPEAPEERKLKYLKSGLSEKLAEQMKLSNFARSFEEFVSDGHDAKTVAGLLLEGFVQLRREGVPVNSISNEMIREVLEALKKNKITKDVLLDVFREWIKNNEVPLATVLSQLKYETVETSEAESFAKQLVEKNASLVKEKKEAALSALMGDLMNEMKGKISGGEASTLIKKAISEFLEKGN